MRRVLLLTVFIVSLCFLNSTLREVSLDGTHSYTSIQSAVDDANNGDIIHVYPGRYFEHIDILEKTVTLQSQYEITNNWDDVLNTIIDANFLSNCIRIETNSNVIINGFLMENGIGYHYNENYDYGGAILVHDNSQLELNNSIIQNSTSSHSGGIGVYENSYISLSGNIIRNNIAKGWGGGLGVHEGTVYFDSINLNSIYNNYSAVQDIYLQFSISTDIILDTLSIIIDEPDGYFISFVSNETPPPHVSVLNPYIIQIDSDLYVSPLGNDNNDGLTPETALQTIAYANRIVQPNSLNPNTIHLLPGTYNVYNNQFFPISMQSHTKLLGAGNTNEDVVIGDVYDSNCIYIKTAEHIEIGRFKSSFVESDAPPSLGINWCNNLYIHDIIFSDNYNEKCGLSLLFCDNSIIENIIAKDIVNYEESVNCIMLYECDNLVINNFLVNDIYTVNDENTSLLVMLDRSDVTATNIVISNTTVDRVGTIFQYSNPSYSETVGNIELNNLLVYNNSSSFTSWMPMVLLSSYHNECFVNNMTIAHNTGPIAMTRFGGDYTIRNSIIYNPDGAYEMGVWVPAEGDTNPLWSNIDIDYSLVRNGISGVPGADNPNNNVLWGVNNIDANPMFRGDVEGDIPVGDTRWVQLTENSPCVNAGTPDTLGMNLPALDITGNPRVWGNIIDMGAHEYNPTVDIYNETAPTPPSAIKVSHFPNPVTPNGNNGKVAFIEFTLPKKPIERPTLEIYNIKGQKVRDIKITQSFSQLVRSAGLSSEDKQSGEYYSQVWDCKDNNRKSVASGIYFYKVSCEGSEAIGKMMVVK